MSITQGYVEEAEIGASRFTVHTEPNPSRVPVVVVTVEEWERMRAFVAYIARVTLIPEEREEADAILDTNGGGE